MKVAIVLLVALCMEENAFIRAEDTAGAKNVSVAHFPPTPPASGDWKNITESDWKTRLTPEQFDVTRKGHTEARFKGEYVNNKAEGTYYCVCCGSELFASKDKFDSGTGWPSFSAAVDDKKVARKVDTTHGMNRTEILCANCDSHLGHVFSDGPKPTGERFCVNSISLMFIGSNNTYTSTERSG